MYSSISSIDNIFLYTPSLTYSISLQSTISISDLRTSLPNVLSQVAQLQRGKKSGLRITDQSLDLSLSTSLQFISHHSTGNNTYNQSIDSFPFQILPLLSGLKSRLLLFCFRIVNYYRICVGKNCIMHV